MRATCPVTVLLPVRNGLPYLADAMDSILKQTHEDFELLVVDDGSTDGTAEFLASVTDRRVRVLPLRGSGLVAALNTGLAESSYDVIARMDADDVCHPDRIAAQLAVLEENPDVVAVGCCYTITDETGRVTLEQHVPLLASYAERQLYFRDAFAHASMMFRKAPVLDLGGYRDIGPCEDYDLWLRLLERGHIAGVCAPPLFSYRVVASGVSQTKSLMQDECRRATRETAMVNRPLRVSSATRIASEGHTQVCRAVDCQAPAASYAFDHLALVRVLSQQRRYGGALRCALGLVLFLLRHPAGLAGVPPFSWWPVSPTGPLTAERATAASMGRRMSRSRSPT